MAILSSELTLERGVLQGSVLSPVLFLLDVDPLLRELECNHPGPSISGTYAGAFAHADDICTVIYQKFAFATTTNPIGTKLYRRECISAESF